MLKEDNVITEKKSINSIKKITIPVWEKVTLTIDEASAYSNVGVNKIRKLADEPRCPFVVHIGNKKLIKRKEFEKYILNRISL